MKALPVIVLFIRDVALSGRNGDDRVSMQGSFFLAFGFPDSFSIVLLIFFITRGGMDSHGD